MQKSKLNNASDIKNILRVSDQIDAGVLLIGMKRSFDSRSRMVAVNCLESCGTCASCGSQCGGCGNSNSNSKELTRRKC